MSTTVHTADMFTQVCQCENSREETLLASPNKETEEHCVKLCQKLVVKFPKDVFTLKRQANLSFIAVLYTNCSRLDFKLTGSWSEGTLNVYGPRRLIDELMS